MVDLNGDCHLPSRRPSPYRLRYCSAGPGMKESQFPAKQNENKFHLRMGEVDVTVYLHTEIYTIGDTGQFVSTFG